MARAHTRVTAVWASGSPTSSALAVPFGDMAGGTLHISGGFTDSKIGIQHYVFGQWQPFLDWQGGYTGVSIASASGNASLMCPPSWFDVFGKDHTVKLWSHDGTGANVAQTGAHTLVLDLKD